METESMERVGRRMVARWARLLQRCFLISLALGCDPTVPSKPFNDATVIDSPPNIFPWAPLQDMEVIVDQDVRGPLFNSLLPSRSPLEGGIEVRLIGEDFREPMQVLIGGEPCTSLVIETTSRMLCEVPPWPEATSVDVSVAWADEGGTRVIEEGLSYYTALKVDSLTPQVGSANGNTEVIIIGEGLVSSTDVRFGDRPALSVTLEDEETLKVITPAGPSSLVDVQVRNLNGEVTLPDAYRWRSPMGVERIEPSWGWIDARGEVKLYGFGLIDDSTVSFADQNATITDRSTPGRLTVSAPSVREPGWVAVDVENGNGAWRTDEGFLYLDPDETSFDVVGLTPQRLPYDLGGYFMIGGSGFDRRTQVTVDQEQVSCTLDAPQRLTCFTPSHEVGEVQVRVTHEGETRTLSLEFHAPLEVYSISPDHASISGGAIVQIRGRGFSPDLALDFDGASLSIERFASPEEIWVRVPPHPLGFVDLNTQRGVERDYLAQAFSYYDPTSRFGGVWGDFIENALHVTTLNIYDFSPIEGVVVDARRFDAPADPPLLSERTDEAGQVTLSKEGLLGPLSVTATKAGFEVHTIDRVVSENVTVLMFPFEPPEGDGDPPPPIQPARIQGTLTGLRDLPKPILPGYTLRAFIDVSHSGQLNRTSNPTPSPQGILTEDGPFELVTRPGQLAIVATAAYVPDEIYERFLIGTTSYWFMRRSVTPIAMGLVRYLSLSPGAEIEEIDVRLDYMMDVEAPINLINPAVAAVNDPLEIPDAEDVEGQGGNASPQRPVYEVRAFLNLGPDGYWELDRSVSGDSPRLNLRYLPDMSAWPDDIQLEWQASAQIVPDRTVTYALHVQREALSEGVDIGPFVGAPYLVGRESGSRVQFGDTLRWAYWPGYERPVTEPPQATLVRFIQNGLPIWSYTLPGGVNELTFPTLPESEVGAGLREGSVLVNLQPLVTWSGLDYQNYTLLDINDAKSFSIFRFEVIYNAP